MSTFFLSMGAILGAMAVGIGAFGAHGLSGILTKNGRIETFETAVKYHFYHTFAILILSILIKVLGEQKYFTIAGYCFFVGILIFSGSLYFLSVLNIRWLGAITPIGGLFFICGWSLLFLGALKI